LSAGQKGKTRRKEFRWRRREESRDCLEIFRVGFFFITVLAKSASYRRYFLLLTGKAVCTTDDAAIISLSPSVSNINSHFLFFHFSCRHIFSNLVCVCVCVWILNWFAAGWGWINSRPKPPGELLSLSKPSAVFLFFFQSPSIQTFGRGII
jgi:hypothetical protein